MASGVAGDGRRRHRRAGRSRRRARPGTPARRRPRPGWSGARWRPAARRRRVVGGTALDGQRPLGHLRQHHRRLQHLDDPVVEVELEAIDGGGGHHDGVEAVGLGQTGGDVAPQPGEGEVGTQPGELGPASHRSGGHQATHRESVERRADEHVAGIGPLRHRGQHQLVGRSAGQVLARVHGEIGPTVEHRGLDLLDEDALAAHLPDRDVEAGVGDGLHDDLLDGDLDPAAPAGVGQQRGDVVGLPQGQGAAPGRGPEVHRLLGHHGSFAGYRSNRSRRASARRSPFGRAGGVLEPDRRLVQQLGHDAVGERLDRLELALVELAELRTGTARARPGGHPRPCSRSADTSGATSRAELTAM